MLGFLSSALSSIFAGKSKEIDPALLAQIASFDATVASLSSRFVTAGERVRLESQWSDAHQKLKKLRLSKRHEKYPEIKGFLDRYEHLRETVSKSNDIFIRKEIARCDVLLSDIDGKSLDDQQRIAVVTDEDRNLVVAGAGCGKTLTIAGKVKYLCKEKGISPEDILLIAFTKKSAEEMNERIGRRLGFPVKATTFHKLGLDIITAATGRRPDVSDDLEDFVKEYFEKTVIHDKAAVKRLTEYFAYYLRIPADLSEFESLGAAYEHEKGADLETLKSKYEQALFVADVQRNQRDKQRTLKNERVKSLEEVSIANFLFLHGVDYEYERLYPFASDDLTRKAYRPDFYLPEYDIYIEHFGIDRDGKLPWLSAVEEQKYIDGMCWKREFHKEHGTTLLETYSYLSSDGKLLSTLEEKLIASGVSFHDPNFIDIFETLYAKQSDRYFSEFINLCCTFIVLYKSGDRADSEIGALQKKGRLLQSRFHKERTALFLQIVEPILTAYNIYLQEQNVVDFADMINSATHLIRGGHHVHPYQWVIVDEFQDTSIARFALVNAILCQTGAKLMCVGDDWQSIYRFAGSDISLFTRFDEFFWESAKLRIERTYRNSQQLIDAAGEFVTKNPNQLKKSLNSAKSLDYPITFMCYAGTPSRMLQRTMDKIIHDAGADTSILLLGRTNYDADILRDSNLFQIRRDGSLIYLPSPQTKVSFLTVHRAKGLEADHVVLLNFLNNTLGFPNKIADDPILELVLTRDEAYPYAEERRLLYVALTRTRNRVFILVDRDRPSEFFREFKESSSVFILDSDNPARDKPVISCPKCQTGILQLRRPDSGRRAFVGCSNYPQCDYTVNDVSILDEPRYCPSCGGFLIKRHGKWGWFYGCSNYPICRYTEDDWTGGRQV